MRLVSHRGASTSTALGVELKGWYLLAKEAEPSFRYRVTPGACSDFDLMAVVPWHLKNVLSGMPIVYEPYIDQARYVAEYRNHWWQHIRVSSGNRGIKPPSGLVGPYPPPKSKVNDEAVSDSGGNFGRVARIGVMDRYVEEMLAKRVSGVQARHWVLFFKIYAEAADPELVTQRLVAELRKVTTVAVDEQILEFVKLLKEIAISST